MTFTDKIVPYKSKHFKGNNQKMVSWQGNGKTKPYK